VNPVHVADSTRRGDIAVDLKAAATSATPCRDLP
jgi:hypothetical protein